MNLSRRALLASLAFLGVPGTAVPAETSSPTATVAAFYDALLALMKEARRLSFDQRYGRLQPTVARTFDLALMTRIAVGPQWPQLSSDQQQRLTDAFSRYTISTYASRFDDFNGERFVIEPNPQQSPNGPVVATRMTRSDGDDVKLNYLMRREDDGTWRVIDMFLSGTVSELATRRSEFVAVLRRDGAEGLVRLLERRVSELRTG